MKRCSCFLKNSSRKWIHLIAAAFARIGNSSGKLVMNSYLSAWRTEYALRIPEFYERFKTWSIVREYSRKLRQTEFPIHTIYIIEADYVLSRDKLKNCLLTSVLLFVYSEITLNFWIKERQYQGFILMKNRFIGYLDNAITGILLVVAGVTPLLFLNQTTEFYEMPKLYF